MVISHHNGSKGRVLSMHDLVVNRPEPMEVQSILVVFNSWLHFQVGLVANNMVHFLESDGSQDLVEFLG